MKKICSLLLIAALAAAFASCGGDTDTTTDSASVTGNADTQTVTETQPTGDAAPETEAVTEAPAQTASAVEGYTCIFDNGLSLKLGDAADAISVLGDYSDMMEAPSCVHEGYDRVYTWAGLYTVTTSPNASGTEYIAEISLLSDLVALDVNGSYLMIGSPEADIKSAFGDPAEDAFGVQKYFIDGANITVTVDGGAVTGLVLTYPVS